MKLSNIQFIIDEKGEKSSVIIPLKIYLEMLELIEELEDIRLYDEAKSREESSMSLEDYRQQRQKRKQYALSNSNSQISTEAVGQIV